MPCNQISEYPRVCSLRFHYMAFFIAVRILGLAAYAYHLRRMLEKSILTKMYGNGEVCRKTVGGVGYGTMEAEGVLPNAQPAIGTLRRFAA
jgi:hypothetical protein